MKLAEGSSAWSRKAVVEVELSLLGAPDSLTVSMSVMTLRTWLRRLGRVGRTDGILFAKGQPSDLVSSRFLTQPFGFWHLMHRICCKFGERGRDPKLAES